MLTEPPLVMPTLVIDPVVSARLIAQRHASNADLFDEVWEGVYVMAPAPNDEHQSLATRLARVLVEAIEDPGLGKVRATINLAAKAESWESDYRVPDLAVFLSGSNAVCHGAFWTGGPDFVIEIISPYDRTREKIEFYEKIGARELLIVDRDPWRLELMRLSGGKLAPAGASTLDAPSPLASEATHLSFHLVEGAERPEIAVAHRDGRTWRV
jgi:Uma2 family endonuclease